MSLSSRRIIGDLLGCEQDSSFREYRQIHGHNSQVIKLKSDRFARTRGRRETFNYIDGYA